MKWSLNKKKLVISFVCRNKEFGIAGSSSSWNKRGREGKARRVGANLMSALNIRTTASERGGGGGGPAETSSWYRVICIYKSSIYFYTTYLPTYLPTALQFDSKVIYLGLFAPSALFRDNNKLPILLHVVHHGWQLLVLLQRRTLSTLPTPWTRCHTAVLSW